VISVDIDNLHNCFIYGKNYFMNVRILSKSDTSFMGGCCRRWGLHVAVSALLGSGGCSI